MSTRTRTYAVLPIGDLAFEEIRKGLVDAKYDHSLRVDIVHGQVIDMDGVALSRAVGEDSDAPTRAEVLDALEALVSSVTLGTKAKAQPGAEFIFESAVKMMIDAHEKACAILRRAGADPSAPPNKSKPWRDPYPMPWKGGGDSDS